MRDGELVFLAGIAIVAVSVAILGLLAVLGTRIANARARRTDDHGGEAFSSTGRMHVTGALERVAVTGGRGLATFAVLGLLFGAVLMWMGNGQMRSGTGQPTVGIQSRDLATYLPEQISGYRRTRLDDGYLSTTGRDHNQASATYSDGRHDFDLTIVDLRDNSYAKAEWDAAPRTDDCVHQRKWNEGDDRLVESSDCETGEHAYGILASHRLAIRAAGTTDAGVVRAAVRSVDIAKLRRLAAESPATVR